MYTLWLPILFDSMPFWRTNFGLSKFNIAQYVKNIIRKG